MQEGGWMTNERRVTDAETGAQKGTKPERYDLIPVYPLSELARVYGKGAEKYADRNWERGYAWGLSYAAMQRHINAFWGGETYDSETGLHHLAHAMFHCAALIEYGRTHPEKDNRPTAYDALASWPNCEASDPEADAEDDEHAPMSLKEHMDLMNRAVSAFGLQRLVEEERARRDVPDVEGRDV